MTLAKLFHSVVRNLKFCTWDISFCHNSSALNANVFVEVFSQTPCVRFALAESKKYKKKDKPTEKFKREQHFLFSLEGSLTKFCGLAHFNASNLFFWPEKKTRPITVLPPPISEFSTTFCQPRDCFFVQF